MAYGGNGLGAGGQMAGGSGWGGGYGRGTGGRAVGQTGSSGSGGSYGGHGKNAGGGDMGHGGTAQGTSQSGHSGGYGKGSPSYNGGGSSRPSPTPRPSPKFDFSAVAGTRPGISHPALNPSPGHGGGGGGKPTPTPTPTPTLKPKKAPKDLSGHPYYGIGDYTGNRAAEYTYRDMYQAQWKDYQDRFLSHQRAYMQAATSADLLNEQLSRISYRAKRTKNNASQYRSMAMARYGMQGSVEQQQAFDADSVLQQALSRSTAENGSRMAALDRQQAALTGGGIRPQMQIGQTGGATS